MNILLLSPPDIENSVILDEVARRLSGPDFRVGGMLREPLRDRDHPVEFRLRPAAGGPSKIFAHRDSISLNRVGRFGIDVEMLNYIVDTCLGRHVQADAFIIDSIDDMTCLSSRFIRGVRRALDGPATVLATIAQHSAPFLDEIKARADVERIDVTHENRDSLADNLLTRVRNR